MPNNVNLLTKLEKASNVLPQVRQLRLQRLQEQLRHHDYAAGILFDPVHIRYAVDARNMTIFHLRHPHRYLLVPVEGRPTLFEREGSAVLSQGLDINHERSIAVSFPVFAERMPQKAKDWAEQLARLLKPLTSGGCKRIAIERSSLVAFKALQNHGFDLHDACPVIHKTKCIKVPGEIELIEAAIQVAMEGVCLVKQEIKPGVTENYLWALMYRHNCQYGGEWVESRLLSSGERTNPWWQEAGMKTIKTGELIGLDTDTVGPFQYCADVSRTFICPERDGTPAKPTEEQKDLYKYANEQIKHNMSLIKPGIGFRELSEKSWSIPSQFVKNRYDLLAHGVGMTNEYPSLRHKQDFNATGYDGVIEENMVLSVESYIGKEGGKEGVKLEDQVVVTSTGTRVLSQFPLESDFLI